MGNKKKTNKKKAGQGQSSSQATMKTAEAGEQEQSAMLVADAETKSLVSALETTTLDRPTSDTQSKKLETSDPKGKVAAQDIIFKPYVDENQMPAIMKLLEKDLSEPYSIYTYRYFIHNWPQLCILAESNGEWIGVIVCKADVKKGRYRGYIAMLAIDRNYRRMGIGSRLVRAAIDKMVEMSCDEVVLETELTNHAALRLYEALGFVRDKRLFKYYLNGGDAFRLKLWLN